MAVTLTGAGGLMTRLGKLKYLVDVIDVAVGANGTADAWPKELNDALVTYDGASNELREAVGGMLEQLASTQTASMDLKGEAKSAAQATLVQMVNDDGPLTDASVESALQIIVDQMVTAAATVNANEPTVAATTSWTDGNGSVVVSIKKGDGVDEENTLAETINCEVTAASSPATATVSVKGEVAVGDKLSHQWPLGSGEDITVTAIDAASSSSSILTNGSFGTWPAAVPPDNWTADVGASGVDWDKGTAYKGTNGLEFTGDGATKTQLSQDLSSSNLKAKTPYAVNLWVRSIGVPTAGILQVDLYDGSAIIKDEDGLDNSFTVDLTAVGVTYVAKSAVFRLPEPVPATIQLRIHTSTALAAADQALVDHVGMAAMTRVGDVGPYVSVFSGSADFSLDDSFTIAVTNDRSGKVQIMFDVFFNAGSLGLQLPSATAGAETIADSVVG